MKRLIYLVIMTVASCPMLMAQKSKPATVSDNTPPADSFFQALQWRNIGPFRGGRANAVAGVRHQPQVFFAGYTGGGVWKTADGGMHWQNVSDGYFGVGSVGDIAVSESDPNVVYVGTGEHAVRGVMTSYGDGVYKSTDGGASWQHVGLTKTRHISDVVIHPGNADVVYVGAQGTVHGPSADRGVYKSTDGGLSWRKTLFVNDSTGVSSLSMDYTNPRILYAATWQHQRLPWKVVSGGPGSAIYKSTDGGETWKKIVTGLPASLGKIGVAVSRANPNTVYAIVEAEKSKAGLYRSTDGGAHWTLMSNDQSINSRSWYYMEVFPDPQNEQTVYVLNAPMMKSIDGGKTFTNVRVGHGDTHDLWINPDNAAAMGLADDGGVEISYNGGGSWSTLMNQPTAQFYRVNVDNRFPYRVYGGQQDNSSVMIKSRTNGGGIGETDWSPSAGCESSSVAFDPNNPELVYGGCYQGYIEVLDTRTGEGKDIQAYPSLNLAVEPRQMKYRFNWNAPIVVSQHDPATIYHGSQVVLKTTDGGMSWQAISPDLTRNDTAKQGEGGGPHTNEGAGGENYNTIYYIAESPLEKGILWTGSDCGLVYLTRDGGQNWKQVTPPGLAECNIHSIEVSPHDKGTAYISATRYKLNDYGSYTYKTTDYGATWTQINTGIKTDDFIKVIREDKKVKDLLYAGSERGFYISYNGGLQWQALQLNLPVVPITDLKIHNNDLVAATAGRAFWILDDLRPLQQGQSLMATNTLQLSAAEATVRYSGARFGAKPAPGATEGQNPVEGVLFDYFLPKIGEKDSAVLEIRDNSGKLLRTYSSKKQEGFKPFPGGPPPPVVLPAKAGLNRFAWDLRVETVSPVIKGAFVYGDYRGHRVAPGSYKAILRVNGQQQEASFTVTADPALKASPDDWQRQQAFVQQAEQDISDIHQRFNDMEEVKNQVQHYNSLLEDKPGQQALVDSGKALIKAIEAWQNSVVETRQRNVQDVINWPGKLNAEYFNLKGLAEAHDPRITKGMTTKLSDLQAEWARRKAEADGPLQARIKAYNAQYKAADLPAVMW